MMNCELRNRQPQAIDPRPRHLPLCQAPREAARRRGPDPRRHDGRRHAGQGRPRRATGVAANCEGYRGADRDTTGRRGSRTLRLAAPSCQTWPRLARSFFIVRVKGSTEPCPSCGAARVPRLRPQASFHRHCRRCAGRCTRQRGCEAFRVGSRLARIIHDRA